MKHQRNVATEGPGYMWVELAQMNDQEVLRILNEIRQKQSINLDSTQDNAVSNEHGYFVSDGSEDHDETHFSSCQGDNINYSNTCDSTLNDMGVEMLYDNSDDHDYIEQNRPSPKRYNDIKKLSNEIQNEPIPFEYSGGIDTAWGHMDDDKYTVRLNDFCSNGFGCIGGGVRRYTNSTSSPESKSNNRSRRHSSEIRMSLIEKSLIHKIRSKESSLIDDCATFDNEDGDDVDQSTIMDQYESMNTGFVEKYQQRNNNLNRTSTPVHSGCKPMFQDLLRRLTGMDEDDENNNATVQHMTTQYGQNDHGIGILVENDDETKMTYDTFSTSDNKSKVNDCQNYDTTGKYSPSYKSASDDITRYTDNYPYYTNDNSVFTARSHDTKSIYTNGEYTYGTSSGSTASDENDTLDDESQTEYTYDTVITEKTR